MRKNFIITLLLSLLALFPGLMPAQTLTSYEYWFDDDVNGRQTGTMSGTNDAVTLNADARGLSQGIHRLNFRARQSDGMYSAVSTSVFIKVAAGVGNKLEYWLDDDRSDVHILEGSLASDGEDYLFVNDLDLGDISPGYHRLYCRARSSSGRTASAVSMSPIIVKSRYYHDENEPILVEKYGIAVDNGETEIFDVPNPREIITQHHILDASKLSPGSHTVKATFWNSLDASASVEQGFNVTVPETPSITLSAQQEGGLVKLHFNSVANDKGYRLYRTLDNGTPIIVDHKSGSIYPSDVNYNDDPAAGTYKYQAWIPYTDRDGTSKVLKSNEVSVTVTQALTEEEAAAQYGTIMGRIVCDKNTPTSGSMVRFSNDNQTVPVQGVLFSRNKMPQGTEVTLTVEGDETHEYEPVTVTVGEGITEVTINGTLIEENQPNNLRNDLEISQLQLTSQQNELHLKMRLKNLYQERPWRGTIRVKAISKKMAEDLGHTPDELDLFTQNMYVGTLGDFSISGGDSKYVELDMQGLTVDKRTDYYFYFESIGKFDDTRTGSVTKPIAANSHSDVNSNPIIRTVNPRPVPQQEYTKWNNEAKEAFAYLMLGAASVTPGSEGLIGDTEEFAQQVMTAIGATSREAAALAIGLWLEGKDGLQAINDANLKLVSDAAKEVFKRVSKQAKKQIIKKFWTTMANVLDKDVSNAKTIVGFIVEAVKVSKKSKFEQCMTCMSILYGALASGPASVSNDMKALMVVGQSLIDEAINILQAQNNWYIINRLVGNRVNTISSDPRTNTAVDFKLIVNNKKKGKHIDFTKKSNHEQIDFITINAMNSPTAEPSVFSFNLKYYEDSIMLETVQDGNIKYTGGQLMGTDVAYGLYMEIHWASGRITQVPLMSEDEYGGVDIQINEATTPMALPDEDFMKEPPVVYVITLTTKSGEDNMADDIYLGTNSERK